MKDSIYDEAAYYFPSSVSSEHLNEYITNVRLMNINTSPVNFFEM